MDRALTELAEATMGLNSELSWTLSEDIARRQVSAVFTRCSEGDLSPDQALDVCMDCMNAKLAYTMEVFNKLFTTLATRADLRGLDLPAMIPLQEFFMGLEDTTRWSTSDALARNELRPVFGRCASGGLSASQALNIFVDNMTVKRDYTLQLLQDMVRNLAVEIKSLRGTPVGVEDDEST